MYEAHRMEQHRRLEEENRRRAQHQLEQERIMRQNAREKEQMELHAKAIEEAKALEAKRRALVAEEEKRERMRRDRVCLVMPHLLLSLWL